MENKGKITNIKLSKRDFKDEDTGHKIEEILQYENLKSCTLYKFYVEENDIKTINNSNNLISINFDFCYFNMEEINLNPKIEYICLSLCENVKFRHLKNTKAKNIEIIHWEKAKMELDLSEIEYAENLEDLAIHNCKVIGIQRILEKAPNLKRLNLDGAIVEDIDALKELRGKINISNEKYFYLTSK